MIRKIDPITTTRTRRQQQPLTEGQLTKLRIMQRNAGIDDRTLLEFLEYDCDVYVESVEDIPKTEMPKVFARLEKLGG